MTVHTESSCPAIWLDARVTTSPELVYVLLIFNPAMHLSHISINVTDPFPTPARTIVSCDHFQFFLTDRFISFNPPVAHSNEINQRIFTGPVLISLKDAHLQFLETSEFIGHRRNMKSWSAKSSPRSVRESHYSPLVRNCYQSGGCHYRDTSAHHMDVTSKQFSYMNADSHA